MIILQNEADDVEKERTELRDYLSKATVDERDDLEKDYVTGIKYKNAVSRGELAQKLFEKVLKFDQVRVCKNYSKAQIIKVLQDLAKRAKKLDFDNKRHHKNELLTVSISWVGFNLQPYN